MAKITRPEEFFGHRLGADRKIVRWDKIVEYFSLLQEESKRIKVVDMGETTEGNPFLVAYISSEENLSNMEKLQKIILAITDPQDRAID